MPDDPALFSIKVSERIGTGDVSPVELVERSPAKIERVDDALSAFVAVIPERARRVAEKAEAEIRPGRYREPFLRVPQGEDFIGTGGMAKALGSVILGENVQRGDVAVIAPLEEARRGFETGCPLRDSRGNERRRSGR